jgi:putative phosphoesterase
MKDILRTHVRKAQGEEITLKILFISDSHGRSDIIHGMAIVEEPDTILHMGDSEGAFKILADLVRLDYPDCKLYDVRGNCDIDAKLPEVLTATLAGKRFYMMHGHQFGKIKNDGVYDRSVTQAKQNNADVLL